MTTVTRDVQNRDFEAHNAPAGDRFDGNALVTPKGWVERVWFNTDVHAWETVAKGGTRGSICLVDENRATRTIPIPWA